MSTPPGQVSPEKSDEMIDTIEAAKCIGLSPSTLETDRCRRRLGLAWYKVGRRCLYRRSDLAAYIESRRRE